MLSSHRAGAIGEALRNIGHLVANDVEAICRGLGPDLPDCPNPRDLIWTLEGSGAMVGRERIRR